MEKKEDRTLPYVCNLFAFPEDYFEQHTAEELKVTEDERQDLIKMKRECEQRRKNFDPKAHAEAEAKALEEFEKEFFEE